MRMDRTPSRKIAAAVMGLLVLSVSAPLLAQDEPSDAPNVYSQLPEQRLIETLRHYGMSELLEAYLAGVEQGPEVLMGMATQPGVPLDERNSLLDRAIAQLTDEIDQASPQTFMDVFGIYEQRYLQAQALIQRAEPYLRRVIYCEAGPADIAEARQFTGQASSIYEELILDIIESVQELRTGGGGMSSADYIILMPRLEQIQLEVGYRGAWSYVYHAMVMPTDTDSDARRTRRLLEDAMELVGDYTRGDDIYGVQADARYLTGMAQRLSGQPDRAMDLFNQIIQSNASVDHKFNALFQGPRTLADAGRFGPAMTMREQFKAEAARLLAGTSGEVDVDLRYADLGYYISTRQAAATPDPSTKAQLDMQGQLSLLSFLQAYSDNQGIRLAYYQRLAERSRDQDPEQLGSIFLIAQAWDKYLKWQASESEAERTELRADGLGLLDVFLSRDDEIVTALQQEAMKLKTYWGGKGNRVQAREFFDLGLVIHEEDPDNLEGADMVANAVRLMHALIADIEASGERVPVDVRQEFVSYSSFALSQPQWLEGRPELKTWFFELGWNRQQIALMLDTDDAIAMRQAAVEAYQSVPRTIVSTDDNVRQYMEARAKALDLRVLRLRDIADGYTEREEPLPDSVIQQFTKLRADLRLYGQEAQDAARKAAAAGLDAFRMVLMQWGSEMEFTAAEVLYDPLRTHSAGSVPLALSELADLPDRWPGTDIQERCAELRIRVLVDDGKIAEAVTEVQQFMRDFPERAQALIDLVATQVRMRINELRYSPGAETELATYQQNYHELASALFDATRVGDGAAGEAYLADNYRQAQMYAESLYEVARYADALALFERCRDLADARLADRKQEIEATFAELESKVTAARDAEPPDLDALEALAAEQLQRIREAGYGEESDDVKLLAAALKELEAARAEPDERRRAGLLNSATQLLGRELIALIRRGKAREMAMLPVDPANIHGIARCQIATGLKLREDGQVDEATALLDAGLITYADILNMLDPNADNEALAHMFWLVTLERIAAASEVYWADAANLTKVVSLIIQLEVQGIPASWVPQFDALKRRCKQQLAELGSPWEDAANN